MKTIIIPLFDGMITRNLLFTDVKKVLIKRGIRLVLLPPEGKGELYEQKWADGKNIFVDKTPVWKNSRLDSIFINLFLQSIPTKFMRVRQVDWYWYQKKYIFYVVVSILRFFGRFRIYRWLIRKIALLQPVQPAAREIFDRWQPDLIFAPTMIPVIEVSLMRLAKEHGKMTIGMAKSWDNLTSKAFIRVFPDWVIVHNEMQIEEAATLFDYPRERVVVTGIPQMDDYVNSSLIEPREAFCKKLGLDPKKRIFLYAPAGNWMNKLDVEVFEMILDWIDAGEFPNCQILLRLHPAYASKTESFKGRANLVVERPGKQFGERLKSVEFDDEDIHHLASSLKHSDIVFHTASTIGLEAAFLDRPVINLALDGKQKKDYWHSVVRYYDREHCIPFIASGGGRFVKTADELKAAIHDYLKDPSLDHNGRERLVSMLCYKKDGKAGERIGTFIADIVEGKRERYQNQKIGVRL